VNIGPARRVIEIEPATLPLPETLPDPAHEPVPSEPAPVPSEPER
jgi:hypothetical protein